MEIHQNHERSRSLAFLSMQNEVSGFADERSLSPRILSKTVSVAWRDCSLEAVGIITWKIHEPSIYLAPG